MSDDVLSQAEVENLLSQMQTAGDGATKSPAAARESSAEPSTKPREKIVPYDFKRPERVGKEQMRALQTLHEGFARNFGAALSGLLRSIVEVKLTSVDQLTYSEFVFSLENPTCFNLLKAEPLEGNLILDINPSILYPIIDRLLGGGRDPTPLARRPLTEIELRLVARITSLFLEEFRRAWDNVLELKLAVERVESNPQLVQIVPPNEVVVLISFEIAHGRNARDDEPVHSVQLDRTHRAKPFDQQLGCLRPPRSDAGNHAADHPQPAWRAGGTRGPTGRDENQHRRPDRPAQWGTSSRPKKT